MFDLLIRNGMVVSPESTKTADVAIKDGIVQQVGQIHASVDAKRVIDASGLYLLPGVIEAHMHCYAPFQGCVDENNFYTQSISAAHGGVTMFMDFANTYHGDSLLEKVLVREREMRISAIDYSVHGKIVEFNETVAKELAEIIELGFLTYKLFMIYRKEGVMSSDETMLEIFDLSKKHGGLPMLHCESEPIAVRGQQLNQNDFSWKNFAKSKPVLCESEAFARAMAYGELTESPLLIVHTTNKKCLDIARLQHECGRPVYIETCPQYLVLDDSYYEREDGFMAVCSPPLRNKEEQPHLWDGLADGTISLIGSDDCTYSVGEKSKYLKRNPDGSFVQDYNRVPGGISGIEIRLPIMLSEGVNSGRITLNQLVAVTSANVAKVYGCYPRKGIIAPNSDADIVLVDMNKEVTVSQDMLHNNIDYCVYEGMKLKGYPIMTIANGKVIVENGDFCGKKGSGRFVKRKFNPAIHTSFGLEAE